jgi:muramoyltetrapeptide carboxypeptidase
MERGLAAIHKMGFETKQYPSSLGGKGLFAASDDERAADLAAAFADPKIDAVLCSRGGYGCARLLARLDLGHIAASGKPFLGYSDITTLHLALAPLGVTAFYSPMVISFAHEKPEWMKRSFIDALAGDFSAPEDAAKGTCGMSGRTQGIIDGGCLTLLADSLGTRHAFNGRGKLVLLEDTHEKPHRIDAMLTHLLNAGALEGVAGFVIGEMTGTNELAEPDDPRWQDVVRERLGPLNVPMIFNFPFGHVDAILTLPLGILAEMDADAGTLNYLR